MKSLSQRSTLGSLIIATAVLTVGAQFTPVGAQEQEFNFENKSDVPVVVIRENPVSEGHRNFGSIEPGGSGTYVAEPGDKIIIKEHDVNGPTQHEIQMDKSMFFQ